MPTSIVLQVQLVSADLELYTDMSVYQANLFTHFSSLLCDNCIRACNVRSEWHFGRARAELKASIQKEPNQGYPCLQLSMSMQIGISAAAHLQQLQMRLLNHAIEEL